MLQSASTALLEMPARRIDPHAGGFSDPERAIGARINDLSGKNTRHLSSIIETTEPVRLQSGDPM